MFIRKLSEAQGTARQVKSDNWNSVRLLLENDNMGFSFHITTLYAGTETHMWYKNHYESVYCISGRAEIEDKATGEGMLRGDKGLKKMDKLTHAQYLKRGLKLARPAAGLKWPISCLRTAPRRPPWAI